MIIIIINTTVRVLIVAVFIYTLLRYFIDPYHPVITTLAQVIEPLLAPIRKHVPPMGGMDFSPLILMLGLQVLRSVIVALLRRIG